MSGKNTRSLLFVQTRKLSPFVIVNQVVEGKVNILQFVRKNFGQKSQQLFAGVAAAPLSKNEYRANYDWLPRITVEIRPTAILVQSLT